MASLPHQDSESQNTPTIKNPTRSPRTNLFYFIFCDGHDKHIIKMVLIINSIEHMFES